MKKPPKLDLSLALHLGLVVATALLFLFTYQSPLLGTLGFESANLLVTLFGPAFCLTAALNQKININSYNRILFKEIMWLSAYIVLIGGLLFFNGLYVTSCSQGAGPLPFLVILLPPLLLNISIGALLSALINSRALKFLLVILGYAAYFAFLGFSWWLEPSFRLFSHPSIIISSDLLQGDTLTPAVLGFRASTLLLALAIMIFGSSFISNARPKVFSKSSRRPFMSLAIISLIMLAQVTLHYKSLASLGKDRTQLLKDYELLAEKNNLKVFADPLKTSNAQAKTILDEALFYQATLKKRLGTLSVEPITIWLYDTNEDKFLYTGAKNVHFALPKHREIHLTGYQTPHDVLGHELAHIYVGERSDTLLGTPGTNHFIPNLALTEGLAVVLTKELTIDNDLTVMEQAQALYHANIRVDIDRLFKSSIYFALFQPRASYIYAGAALEFLLKDEPEAKRLEKITHLIKTGSINSLFASEPLLSEKIAAFNKFLSQDIEGYKKLWAEKNFITSSIILSDCSDNSRREKTLIKRSLLNRDIANVQSALKHLLKNDQRALLNRAIDSMLEQGAFDFAKSLTELKESLKLDDSKEENIAFNLKKIDYLINLEQFAAANKILDSIDETSIDHGTQRLVTALRMLMHSYRQSGQQDNLSKSTMSFVMAKPSNQSSRQIAFAYALGKSNNQFESDSYVLASYLYARLEMRLEHYQEALPKIISLMAHKERLPAPFARELLSMLAFTHFTLNHHQEALATYEDLLASATTAGEKLFIENQIERINFKQKR
jgi:hypothetical protein